MMLDILRANPVLVRFAVVALVGVLVSTGVVLEDASDGVVAAIYAALAGVLGLDARRRVTPTSEQINKRR